MYGKTDSSKNEILMKYLKVLCRCYSTGHFEELFPFLSEEAVLESMWVFSPMTGKKNLMEYYTAKGETLRRHDCCPECKVIRLEYGSSAVAADRVYVNGRERSSGSVALYYPDGKYAMFMIQEGVPGSDGTVVDLTLDEEDKIARIDLCMHQFFSFSFLPDEP